MTEQRCKACKELDNEGQLLIGDYLHVQELHSLLAQRENRIIVLEARLQARQGAEARAEAAEKKLAASEACVKSLEEDWAAEAEECDSWADIHAENENRAEVAESKLAEAVELLREFIKHSEYHLPGAHSTVCFKCQFRAQVEAFLASLKGTKR